MSHQIPRGPQPGVKPHERPDAERNNPKSEYYVPNDAGSRKGENPDAASWEGPAYAVNAESLCISSQLGRRPHLDPLKGVLALVDHINTEGFHLEPICRACESWKPATVNRPVRRGAVNSTETCFGCHFGHLDGLTGPDGAFVNVDRSAAFSAWASAKADVRELELRRAAATGMAKAKLATRLEKAYKRVERAWKRCKRLGFTPSMPQMGQEEWVAPLSAPTRDNRRRDRERAQAPPPRERRSKTSPSCRNCRNWTESERLSGPGGTYGECWVLDYATRASFFCVDHNPREH